MDATEYDFSQLRVRFKQAEDAIKRIEKFDKELPFAAVNELRYTCYHLLRVLTEEEAAKNYQKAENHIDRALYDAYEAGIVAALKYLEDFHRSYSVMPELRTQLPTYNEILVSAKKASEQISEVVEKEVERGSLYESCRQHFETLANGAYILKELEPTLLQSQRDQYLQAVRRKLGLAWGVFLSVLGGVVGALAAMWLAGE